MPEITEKPKTQTLPRGTTSAVSSRRPRWSFLSGKKSRLISLIVLGTVLVGSVSAAAYYGVVAPNKPENILKTAIEKQLQKQQATAKGTLNMDFKKEDSGLKNMLVTFNGANDTAKKAFSADLELAASGAKVPLEVRGIDNSLFFKVGDLSSVKGLAALAGGPESIAFVDVISSKVSNQWLEVDQTLLKQINTECTTSIFGGFSQQDIDEIMKVYGENSFLSVKSKTAEQVEGRDATRYDLSLDKARADQFGEKLGDTQAIKRIKACSGSMANQGDDPQADVSQDADVSMAVWVDADKNLRQLEIKSSDDETASTVTIIFTDDQVNVQKPEGAKPIMEVLGDFSTLLGGATAPTGSTANTSQSNAALNDYLEGMSDSCKAAFQAYMTSGGTTQLPAECL